MQYRVAGAGRRIYARCAATLSGARWAKLTIYAAGLTLASAGVSAAIDYQLYSSAFPTEHFDSLGTSTTATGGLTNLTNVQTTTVRNFEDGFVFLTRDPSELYLVGGMAVPTTNYISKVDPKTLAEIKRTSLDCPRPACPYNNIWAPSAAIHSNGYIYVSAESRVWKLDKDVNVVGFYNLPLKDGAYNSLKILSDGNILVKGFGPDDGDDNYSALTIVTPDLQPVVANYVLPDKAYGRIAVLSRLGKEAVYLTGATRGYRLLYNASASPVLKEDTTWSFTYRAASDTATSPGGLMTFLGNEAYFMDNCQAPIPTGPMHLIRMNLDSAADSQIMTPFPGTMNGYRFNKHLVDPINNVIVVSDSENGLLAGYRYLGNGNYSKLWQQPLKSKVIITASAATRQLYVTAPGDRGSEDVVIVDTVTGAILKRIPTGSNIPSVAVISVGFNKDIFYNNGTRISMRIFNP